MSGTASVATYVDSDTEVLSASNGVEYAYRVTGTSDSPPLVTLQHFRGNLDSWDPALIDALAAGRRVITFDNRGVAATSGRTPSTMAEMALDAIDFIDALDLGEVDLLGFSIGSFLAQEIALIRPASVRKLVLASSAPKGASGMHGWAPAVIGAVGKPETSGEEYLSVFFAGSDASRAAGQEVLGRLFGARTPTVTPRSDGRPASPSTTPCAAGASPATPCSSGSPRSTSRSSSPTATATR
jgi:pimeloyl-ACP methyl ester carboxylesterase